MTTGIRKPGEFCWINILTPQPAEARAFFGALLGWTYAEIPGMGHRVQVGGRDIGGLFDVAAPNSPPGTPPQLGVMVKVDSADDICRKIRALGGKAMDPFDIMANLRMAVCHDPNGAQFDIWEPRTQSGTEVDSALHGAPSWFETLTTDVERAVRFYSGLFGWTAEVVQRPGPKYTVFKQGVSHVAGAMQVTPQMPSQHPHWATYFTVKSADVAAREAVTLGAGLCVPVTGIPDIGRFCGITSPQGITFYVIEYSG